ncbi:MAG: tetratricopeptide repeat protein, partial [Planctomycetaceae bacterium]
MAVDVYKPCGCGSGKKLKFCCLDILEHIAKVQTYIDNNQSRMALQALERLEKSHPGRPWTAVLRATLLIEQEDVEDARGVLARLLESQPDHPVGRVLSAMARLGTEHIEACMPEIERVFRDAFETEPALLSDLAMSVAAAMFRGLRYMAARQYLVLGMRLAPEEQRQAVFLRLLEFESNGEIPYPLRSVHPLAEYVGEDAAERQFLEAGRLANVGNFSAAAEGF